MQTIPLIEVLQTIAKVDGKGKPIPFSIKFVTYDRRKKTGGEIKKYAKAILNKLKHVKPPAKSEKKSQPKHYDNSTRNIQILPSGEIKKLHIRLITEFNGLKVYY